jgi:hypothetical protein
MTRRLAPPPFLALPAVLALALGTAAACGSSTPAGGAATATATPSQPASTAPGIGCDTGAWQTAPVTVSRRITVPPVPVITAVRTAAHPECGYDRIVLGVAGPVPGYTIRYVTQVSADPSGMAISMPGRRFLLLTLRPAQAHTGSGAATISRQVQVAGYPMLTSWAVAGDFEGVVTLALGLRDTASIRVGELPGRLYIDLKT